MRTETAVSAEALEAHQLADEGEREIRAGNFSAAEEILSRAEKMDLRSARVRHLLGVSLHERGSFDRAIACYRKAVKLDPGLALLHRDLAAAYVQKHMYGDALACYREAIRQDPDDEVAWQGAGSALREMGDIVAARKHYQRALAIKLKNWLRKPWAALFRRV